MMQTVIQQLAQVLTILSGSAQLMLEGKASGSSAQMLRLWLQPTARMATAAMHRLRHLPLGQLAATNDLSQSLTVLVLASDLISQGYLAKDNGQESYELMLRNAARAMKSLGELRDELATNELYAEDV